MPEDPPELPPLPPEFPVQVTAIDFEKWFKLFWRVGWGDDQLAKKLGEALPKVAGDLASVFLTIIAAVQGKVGQMVGASIVEAEEAGQENLMQAAAFGLRDLFGVGVSAGEVGGPGDTGAREALAERLGHLVMEAMFGSLPGGEGITPEQGKANAERLFGFNLGVALKGWMMGLVGLGFIEHFFPSWGNLKEIVSDTLGLGRIQRRALAPLLNALIVEPFTADLNTRFRPKRLTVSEAAHALHRGVISESDYFEMAAQEGYTRERAAHLRVVYSKLPSVAEARALFNLGVMDQSALRQNFTDLGYHPDFVDALVHLSENDRIMTYKDRTESIVTDMIASREMDDTEGEGILRSVGRTEAEIETLLGNARLLRSRPKRLTEAQMQQAFEEGFASLGDLTRYHQLEGYSPEDGMILEQLAIHKKLISDQAKEKAGEVPAALKPRRVSESMLLSAFVDGMLSPAQLDAALADAGYGPDQRALIEGVASKRKADAAARAAKAVPAVAAPRERKILEGTLAELFVRGIIGEDALRRYLQEDGYRQADQDALIALALQRRQEAQLAKAAGRTVPTRPLSQADLLKAFAEGFITLAQLDAGLTVQRFTRESIAVLEQMAQRQRDQVLARERALSAQAEAAAAAAAGQIPATAVLPAPPKRRRRATKTRATAPEVGAPAA